ncbi:MAG: hypothetical protein RJA25_1350 [Bacteroidota bacterium]|jgi:ABC-type bacteriocin/lantibiotic exporter with double-glycine peptidase domain
MHLPIVLSNTAQQTLTYVIDYIDSINTKGVGQRWYRRFKNELTKYANAKNDISTLQAYRIRRTRIFLHWY